ncbi:hypothetical protein LSH36_111g02014 [Paralvinella palmiformis]|uniref:EF-hand domain-containing protein n=1 Tax=Paralvinella palmiformis TaxID=53620 RepID=A0AAD9NB47_9ANNE|nr:hypothetical protein LSH36_111g02014 [Paralvinella palmiformis]
MREHRISSSHKLVCIFKPPPISAATPEPATAYRKRALRDELGSSGHSHCGPEEKNRARFCQSIEVQAEGGLPLRPHKDNQQYSALMFLSGYCLLSDATVLGGTGSFVVLLTTGGTSAQKLAEKDGSNVNVKIHLYLAPLGVIRDKTNRSWAICLRRRPPALKAHHSGAGGRGGARLIALVNTEFGMLDSAETSKSGGSSPGLNPAELMTLIQKEKQTAMSQNVRPGTSTIRGFVVSSGKNEFSPEGNRDTPKSAMDSDLSNSSRNEGYPEADWSRIRKTPAPSQDSSPRYKRTRSKRSRSNPSALAGARQGTPRAYITEFSDDDSDSFLDGSINVLDDDGGESFDSDAFPLPDNAVDIYNGEGYDTDLEIDREEFLNGGKNFYDPTGIKDYIRECNRLGVLPVTFFQRHVMDREFVMRNHGLGPLGAKAISKPLELAWLQFQGNTVIERLDLEGNDIEGEGCFYLCKVLRDNCYITKLVLSENGLRSSGCKAVCDMIVENSTLQDVDLSGNGFKDCDGEHIYRLLQGNKSVHTLNLRYNKFEIEGARWFRDAMITNVSLHSLDLSWNHFRLKGAVFLAEMIQENYGLKYLNLAMNGLGNEGATAIGRALAHNQCLEEINLSNNRISDSGCSDLAKGLQANEILTTFRMGLNPLSPEGTMPLVTSLYKNDSSSIHLLDITNIVVTEQFETLLNEKIRNEKSRELQVVHGGVLFKKKQLFTIDTDLDMSFESDPMTKLKRFAHRNKLRLVDVFRQLDKDQSNTLSEAEFLRCIESLKEYGFDMTPKDIASLIQRLDRNGDGELDFGELLEGDQENRIAKRRFNEWKEQSVQVNQFELDV